MRTIGRNSITQVETRHTLSEGHNGADIAITQWQGLVEFASYSIEGGQKTIYASLINHLLDLIWLLTSLV